MAEVIGIVVMVIAVAIAPTDFYSPKALILNPQGQEIYSRCDFLVDVSLVIFSFFSFSSETLDVWV